MRKSLSLVIVTLATNTFLTTEARADGAFIELPANMCDDFANSGTIRRTEDYFYNNSTSSSVSVYCPVPLAKSQSLNFPGPTTIGGWQLWYIDGSQGNISCFPLLRFSNGTEVQGATQTSSGSSGNLLSFTSNNPFNSIDISGQAVSLTIKCTIPASNQFLTGLVQYTVFLQYSH